MKRFLAIMICVLVAVFSFTGCGTANPAATPAASPTLQRLQKVHLLRKEGFRQAGYLEVHDEQS